MSILIAIDPGLQCTGIAVFDAGVLKAVHGVCTSASDDLVTRVLAVVAVVRGAGEGASQCVIEMPLLYPNGKIKGSGNDIVKLATLAGASMAALPHCRVQAVPPAGWKGQVPKKIHQPRILAKLSAAERALVDKAERRYGAKTHNIIDAIGIGLYALRR
jgi:hypothetical protein